LRGWQDEQNDFSEKVMGEYLGSMMKSPVSVNTGSDSVNEVSGIITQCGFGNLTDLNALKIGKKNEMTNGYRLLT